MWTYAARLAGCPTGYTPTDAVIDLVAWTFNRYLNPDPSHRRRRHV